MKSTTKLPLLSKHAPAAGSPSSLRTVRFGCLRVSHVGNPLAARCSTTGMPRENTRVTSEMDSSFEFWDERGGISRRGANRQYWSELHWGARWRRRRNANGFRFKKTGNL